MKIFKRWQRPRYRYNQRVIIKDVNHEDYGSIAMIEDCYLDWGFKESFKKKFLGLERGYEKYMIRVINEDDPRRYYYGMFKHVKWHQVGLPFDPVAYYKDQPGDLKSDI